MLLERGASPNATDSYGMTPLIGCANSLTWAQAPDAGALRLVEALLAHGARVSTRSMQAVIDKARSCVRCAWPPA